ncbi:unnamed protein product [Parnassius apollo]|uniref:(apollo) hypothetical protein n=1 Tax=Parnassius apollo TaxID=110799 RepID=A0A8S3Y0A0_PARAO|nr:unnamed protein product [Parnassius apollo]
MPKPLSLKKTHRIDLKNQKTITHFFKNSDINGTQKFTLPAKKKDLPDITAEVVLAKRKAVSPLQNDSSLEHKHPLNNSHKKSSPTKHVPKKLKVTNNGDSEIILKDNILHHIHKIPIHDNKANGELSPERLKLEFMEEFTNGDQTFENFNNKSPLSDVSTDAILNIGKSPVKLKSKMKEKENQEYVLLTSEALNNMDSKDITSSKIILTPSKYSEANVTTSEKQNKPCENSPSKTCSTSKVFELSGNEVTDLFEEQWEVENFQEEIQENLDLTTMQRCEIISVKFHTTYLELSLRSDNFSGTCFVEGIWMDLSIQPGETVSILASRNSSGQFHVNNTSGLIVLRPDYLLSSTSVVAGVFCKRKAALQERWRGIDSANVAMTVGILIHELVQKALTHRILSPEQLRLEADNIIKESIQMLFDAGLCEEEARSNMDLYIIPLSDFMRIYVADNPFNGMPKPNNKWTGHIEKVLDIEENICCPQLGLKGKIDATLEVTIHERQSQQREIVPLELKSGRASLSAEHRGQLVLYGMMLSLQRGENPATALQRGLLLYLKERIELREVSCGYPERRDLIMLRNQLVQHLAPGPTDCRIDDVDIEEAGQSLPDPVHHEAACSKCPYLTLCSLHLWHTDGPKVSNSHPLSRLRNDAIGHLSIEHVNYFLHWTRLLKLEEKVQLTTAPLHALWTDSVEKRVKRGTCAANLKLHSVCSSRDKYLHVFHRERITSEEHNLKSSKTSGPQEGDFAIVSKDNRPWLAAGVVVLAGDTEVNILLERDLSSRQSKDTVFHIDTYESYATTVQNLTNLGVLMEDSDRAQRLRRLIIDKKTPTFVKLPREVGRLGAKLMRSLNIEQQRAVLKALAAEDYALLQGLPGTGKTQTISVLIQMLVALKLRVLVTAHTHSAVDTVLCRLPESIQIMRLGSSARVASKLLHRCEEKLTSACETSEQLSRLYDSMEVVGVTCLGAAHAMLARTSFDVCIVDEATQVLQCTVLRPLFAAKRFILVGDPEQLPPVVRRNAARHLGMEESLFHRLMSEEATTTLRLQYRMNQALADLANRIAYNNRLKCANQTVAEACLNIDLQKLSHLHTSKTDWMLTACSPKPKYAAVFINLETFAPDGDVNKQNKTISNLEEVCLVLALVDALKEGGVRPSDIGVIAPYRDQVSLLRRSLAHLQVEASTVDQFQGRDKSVIIYSCTKKDDGQKNKKVKEDEILNDQRRLAVSVTRAKHKFIVLGENVSEMPNESWKSKRRKIEMKKEKPQCFSKNFWQKPTQQLANSQDVKPTDLA